ncbi:MAG: hypothetical protein ABIA75_11980 [Candidatus Neomarinimicrobiota bacterium]
MRWALERARRRINEHAPDLDLSRAEMAVKRVMLHLWLARETTWGDF